MLQLAHIVNPFRAPEGSEFRWAQPITWHTMRTARDFAAREVDVALFTAQYAEDRSMVPDGFTATPDLTRSVLDVGQFKGRRRLPLLVDILDRLYDATEAPWLIFTNIDIAVMPHYYLTVSRLIQSGQDAFVINRRTVSDEYQAVEQIPLMYALIGVPHEGHDCFVFGRDVYRQFRLGLVSVGAPWVGRVLLWNLLRYSQRFEEFKAHHLTFHLGVTDWASAVHSEYAAHNQRELQKVFARLREEGVPLEKGAPLFPYVAEIWDVLGLEEYRPRPRSRWRATARRLGRWRFPRRGSR